MSRYKIRVKKGKIKGDKKSNKKRIKDNKMLNQKSEKRVGKKLLQKTIKKELKIKVLTHELLAGTDISKIAGYQLGCSPFISHAHTLGLKWYTDDKLPVT
jgi:hypothetical protein